MKNLFLLWLLIYVITGTRAFAEKAMSPVLLAPTNFAKNISKDSIKFTWQNAQNEVNAKVNAYRIVISENSQFNGYTPSTGRCNVTCVTNVINSTTFSTGLRSSNKSYYWHVQGLSPTENGEWSRTGTFKTDVPVPSITNASATPSPVIQGSSLTISATLSGVLPNNHSVKLNDNGNLYAMNGSGTSYSFSQSPSIIGSRNYSVGIYDINNNLKSSLFNGSYEVKKPNVAPTLSFISGSTTATTAASYILQVQGNDTDNNLSQVTINWGDGSSNTQNATNGSVLTFMHTYTIANSYTWSATAYDSANATSDNLAKNVIVSKVNTPPTLNLVSGSDVATTGSVYTVQILGKDVDNNLDFISIEWGDGASSYNVASSDFLSIFTHTYNTPNQYTWNAIAYDMANVRSSNLTGNVTVSNAVKIPSISSASASPTSTTLGNSISFFATLNSNLPSNYNVKLNYSNTSVSMSGSGTSYSVSQIPTQLGQQVFTVGVYDSNNVLKGSVFKGNFEIVKSNSPPTLNLINAATSSLVGTSYSVQLQASDTDNNLKSISVVWGDGATDTQNTTNGNILTFTHTYAKSNSYIWTATAMDSSNATSSIFSKDVSVTSTSIIPPLSGTGKLNDTGITTCSNTTKNNLPCPVSNFPNQDAQSGRDFTNNDDSDGHSGFSFTKISSTGASLPSSATSWNCVKDNVTGLIWELKTTDGGLHDQNHTYSWYEPDYTKNGGEVGTQNGGICKGSQCDTNSYVKAVNAIGYCGYKDWRMPTRQELLSIVDFGNVSSAIDSNYFPNTQSNWFWSFSSTGNRSAWSVSFGFGDSVSDTYIRDYEYFVRLVR